LIKVLLGLLGVLGPETFADRIAEVDFRTELSRNKQLAAATPEVQRLQRAKQRARVLEQIRALRRTLWRSFVIVASATIVAALVAMAVAGHLLVGQVSGHLAVLSVALLAWATIGRLSEMGDEAVSWSGETVIERTDKVVFRALYWAGTFAAGLAAWWPGR